MFDVSCLYGADDFYTIQDDAYILWELYPDFDPLESEFAQAMKDVFDLDVIGQHYFVKQNGALEAVWDCTSSPTFQHNPDAIVFAHPIKTAPSPNLNTIVWVELVGDSGGLAKSVYRIDTVEGEPPFIVSSSADWCLSCSINLNVILFIVYPRRYSKFQV
jgi:hypothetical protein